MDQQWSNPEPALSKFACGECAKGFVRSSQTKFSGWCPMLPLFVFCVATQALTLFIGRQNPVPGMVRCYLDIDLRAGLFNRVPPLSVVPGPVSAQAENLEFFRALVHAFWR
ncbi:hypothetical protein [Thiohalobacter thiocyanaticus]|uniref:hypothetical protein n=1 Tax=Thiohalobacter thiocyanaticus TaxID=585455 RepID=UPI000F63675F|nr:hypothetical protein [Thiohalobacter thiocyanaticus]